MTREEHREMCIEAIHRAAMTVTWEAAERAFDSLHGIVRVGPVEATEEMLHAALPISVRTSSDPELWRAMSAAGDLTNAREGKP
jgi:hypothetical protein